METMDVYVFNLWYHGLLYFFWKEENLINKCIPNKIRIFFIGQIDQQDKTWLNLIIAGSIVWHTNLTSLKPFFLCTHFRSRVKNYKYK